MVLKNFNTKNDNRIGQIFTPSYIAEFMVNNILLFIDSCGKEPQSIRVLEPSVGEGIFLKFRFIVYNLSKLIVLLNS